MGNTCCNRKKEKKKIVLLLVGLDNAGKSVAVKGLAGEPPDDVVPTVGLSVTHLKHPNYMIKVFDLGGSSSIRAIWRRYFVDVHGIIFVVDSSDYERLDEARQVLYDLLSHQKISGKPVLILANKQDCQNALDEMDLVEKLDLEMVVNVNRCPTLVQTCSANESKVDPQIERGFQWLLNYIARDYININARVQRDVKIQEADECKERKEKIEKLRKLNESSKRDDDVIESYSDYDRKMNGKITQTSSEHENTDFYITNGHIISIVSSLSSSKSDDSFPCTYYDYVEQEQRPKSALQLVKEQLELTSITQSAFKDLGSNKTVPVALYGVQYSQSAGNRRKQFSSAKRLLKSAGDRATNNIFTVSKESNDMWAQRRFNTYINLSVNTS